MYSLPAIASLRNSVSSPELQHPAESKVAQPEASDTETEPVEGQDALRLLILRAVLKQWLGVEWRGESRPENRTEKAAEGPAEVHQSQRMRLAMQQSLRLSARVELRNDAGESRQVRVQVEASFSLDIRVQMEQDVEMTDPLIVQLGDQPLSLARESYRFDLNLDGLADALPGLNGQAAYLVLDRNNNGRIDDGRELFGPRSGNGFVELAALDENGDGRVDARDTAFASLQLWKPGGSLRPLREAGITALLLNRQAATRDLYQMDRLAGRVREQSLLEGVPGKLLEVDLRV